MKVEEIRRFLFDVHEQESEVISLRIESRSRIILTVLDEDMEEVEYIFETK